MLTGCNSEPEHGLSITAVAPYVSYDKSDEYEATLFVGADNLPISLTAEMIVPPSEEESESVEPENYEANMDNLNQNSAEMMGAAGFMKISAQLASKEIDVIISDYENGQRFSAMESFIPLEEVFTEDELSMIDESLFVSYEELDDDNNPTGNMLPASGIDVSHIEELNEFLVADQLVCHVVSNTENLEAAKEYILSLFA